MSPGGQGLAWAILFPSSADFNHHPGYSWVFPADGQVAHWTEMTTVRIALAAWLGALLLTGTAQAAAPTVRLARGTTGLSVIGTGFQPGERVKVTVWRGAEPTIRWADAGKLGAFAFRLASTARVPRCGSFLIRARGSHGSTAVRKIPLPACHAGGEQASPRVVS
jgi:hypothetical protein